MRNSLSAGDVVLVDLGFVAKVRPCVVLAAKPDRQRELSVVAPLTTEIRGGECEVAFPKPPWLDRPCVLNVAGLLGVEHTRVQRRLGPFPAAKLGEARVVLKRMFGLGAD